MYPLSWTSRKEGIFVRYSYEFKRKCIIDLCSGSLAHLLDSADMVKVTVGEEYLLELEPFIVYEVEETFAVTADVNSDTAAGSGLDDVAVHAVGTEI